MSEAYEAFEVLDDAVIEYYGDAATYYPQDRNAISMLAVFSSLSQREETAYEQTFHWCFVRMADFPEPPKPGDILEAFDVQYRVFDVVADFGAAWKLTLQRVSC